MKVVLLKSGDEALAIEIAKLFNDIDLSTAHAQGLLAERTFVLVAAISDDGEVMGRIYGHVLHRFGQTDLLLYEVDVADPHHRKGVGKAMMEFVKQLSQSRGYGEMWVLTEHDNAPARSLYESRGGVEENSPTIMYVFYPEHLKPS